MPTVGYFDGDTKIPGTTTILGRFKESGGLLYWAHKQGLARKYTDEDIQAKLKRLRLALDEGHEPEKLLEAAYQLGAMPKFPSLNDAQTPHSGSGTLVHDMVDDFLRERTTATVSSAASLKMNEEQYAEAMEKAKTGFRAFEKWYAVTQCKVTATEFSLVCPTHKFGGTLDAVGVAKDGRPLLIDWKSSNGVYADYQLQLGAYAHLLAHGVVNTKQPNADTLDQVLPVGLKHQGALLVRFSKEDASFHAYEWTESELDHFTATFLQMRPLYDTLKVMSDTLREQLKQERKMAEMAPTGDE